MNDMEENQYFCPMPMKWNDIYKSLLSVWKEQGQKPEDKPPVPLILAAWHDTPGLMKILRWKETIAWAEKHGVGHLIPELADDEKFRG